MKLYRIKAKYRNRKGDTQLICSLHHSRFLDNNSYPESNDLNLNFRLEEKTKKTNFLSNSSISALGFVIDEKVKNLLSSMDLTEHRLYNTPVLIEEKEDNSFSWLHFKEDQNSILNNVDWNKSTFIKKNILLEEKNIRISSAEEFLRLSSEDHMISYEPEKLFFIDPSVLKNDMFILDGLYYGVIVSEKLKEKFEQEKITGVSFSEVSELFELGN